VDSLKALDLTRPIREADMRAKGSRARLSTLLGQFGWLAK